jgi:hypothetical protein
MSGFNSFFKCNQKVYSNYSLVQNDANLHSSQNYYEWGNALTIIEMQTMTFTKQIL